MMISTLKLAALSISICQELYYREMLSMTSICRYIRWFGTEAGQTKLNKLTLRPLENLDALKV